MIRNIPDCWVVVRISSFEHGTVDKVLAGWYGGYGGGDSWKLSSRIEQTNEFPDRFEFHNNSGSVYVCYKGAERMSGYMSTQYNSLRNAIEEANKQDSENDYTIQIIPKTNAII
jgi:hypothetical protein